MIRVMIIAAYASVRAGLQSMLTTAPNVEVVSSASGSGELEGLICAAKPNVIVADDDSTDRGALLGKVVEFAIPLVLLTDERSSIVQIAAAAPPGWSCLLKESDAAELAAAVYAAEAGLISFDSSLLPELRAQSSRSSNAIYGDLPDPMSARELEVLQLLAQGLPNKVIANRLSISQHTVKFHVAGILAKLNAGSRTEAVTLGARRGLVTI